MRELAEREGIDLAASYAYSDSESDLPMLRAVGHPVVVNPDADAARGSPREEGWEIAAPGPPRRAALQGARRLAHRRRGAPRRAGRSARGRVASGRVRRAPRVA